MTNQLPEVSHAHDNVPARAPLGRSRRPTFVALSGVLWWLDTPGALFWVVPAALTALVQGVLNAWLFLVARQT